MVSVTGAKKRKLFGTLKNKRPT